MTLNVLQSVVAYFESKQAIPGSSVEEKQACNYLDAGIIDSLGLIEMITEFEERFAVRFTSDDMQSPEFRTIGGLTSIIERRRSG
jgi:acyl carrier protein